MVLNAGQKIEVYGMSSDVGVATQLVYLTIKYYCDFDKSISDCEKTMFVGSLNDDLLTVKNGFINRNGCVKDSSNSSNSLITFTAPYAGVYEFDGRCISAGGSNQTYHAYIGDGYLIKVENGDYYPGETIRFNNTPMKLNKGTSITVNRITDGISDNIGFIYLTIKYLGKFS